ncbi:MAG: glycosyltransferase family 4 protein [Flavobacteriaceae bacterium]
MGAKTNIAPSKYLLDIFQKAGYSNTIYIPNTIELKNYPFTQRQAVLPKLLWVRSFAQIYHPLLAVKVFERLRGLYQVATLCMVGPDKDGSLEECKNYAKAKNLPVVFTGKLEKNEWIALSQAYDIFINTTNFDNTPVSVIEAMALGLPIISTRVGGIPYLLDHKKDALLLPPNDVEAFVDAIVFLCNHTPEVKNLSKKAREKVAQFDWEIVKHLWFEVLGK